jgi:hypothetical protein
MGSVYSAPSPPGSISEKKKNKDATITGIPPGATLSAGTDNFNPPGAGDSDEKSPSGANAKTTAAKDPDRGRGGHPTELGEKQGPSLLETNDQKAQKNETANWGSSGQHVFSMEDDKPPRRGSSPSGSVDSGDRRPSAQTPGPSGSIDSGDRTKEQINNMRDRQEKQQKEQEEKERQERLQNMQRQRQNRKAEKGPPGPSGSVDSGDRRPNLLDPTPKPSSGGKLNMDALRNIEPTRRSLLGPPTLTSAQNARALANIERQRGYYPGSTGNTGAGNTDPSRAINKDALQAIKAFDKKVAPEAEKWEARAKSYMNDLREYKEATKGIKSPIKTDLMVPPTAAQVSANARMVEGLVKVTDNSMLAGLFADSLKDGSPSAAAACRDFLEQLDERSPERAEAFAVAVNDALSKMDGDVEAGEEDSNFEVWPFASGLIKAAGLGAYLPKGYADSWAYRRERAAHLIDEAKKRGITDPILEHIEKALDKDHKHAVRMFDTFFLDPPIGKGPK